jgi:hypothetical protein
MKKDELRSEYTREVLGKGVRGKYFARYRKGTNLVLFDPEVARAFPDSAAVNEALHSLIRIAKATSKKNGKTRPARPH